MDCCYMETLYVYQRKEGKQHHYQQHNNKRTCFTTSSSNVSTTHHNISSFRTVQIRAFTFLHEEVHKMSLNVGYDRFIPTSEAFTQYVAWPEDNPFYTKMREKAHDMHDDDDDDNGDDDMDQLVE
ncbi:hypothetical protein RJT34_26364 [Clitoria ternatea]|uniref:Uncharacterized protein n=1 Tax=Clitoria ternatea TaxID=43366 RepID=A0AAN9F6Q1_CLITE